MDIYKTIYNVWLSKKFNIKKLFWELGVDIYKLQIDPSIKLM